MQRLKDYTLLHSKKPSDAYDQSGLLIDVRFLFAGIGAYYISWLGVSSVNSTAYTTDLLSVECGYLGSSI